MPNPVLVWYDDTGTAPVATLSFSGLVPGTPSAWQTVRIYNDEDGAAGSDPAIGRKVRALARTSISDEFVASGHPLVDQRGVEVQILGGTATGAVPGGVVTLGAGATLALPSIGSTEYVEIRARVTLPSGSGLTDAEVAFVLDSAAAVGLGDVGALATRGVDWGIGRRSYSEILDAFTIAPTGTPDAFVTFGDALGVVQGRPVVDLGAAFEFTNLDSAAAALASGEAYFGLVSLGPSALTVTKGAKAATPLTVANEPALPAGHKRLGRVARPFDATIDVADISVDASPVGFDYLGAAARVVSLSGGRAAVGTQLAVPPGSQSITITASSTETVYILGDGSLSTAPGASVDALPLWEFTADGSSITSFRDRRSWSHAGALREFSVFLSGSSAANKAYLVLPTGPSLGFHPLLGIQASLAEGDPSALGGGTNPWKLSGGSRAIAAASFTTLFTSSGTDDRRPNLAFGATDPEFSRGLMEVATVAGGSTLEFGWVSIPTGGTPSAGAAIRFAMYEVS